MVLLNIATVIGNTLIYTSSTCGLDTNHITSSTIDIVSDLISSYAWLFDVSNEELEKERQIQRALIALQEAKLTIKPAGDILVGVHIQLESVNCCLNVGLFPTMTARDLVLKVIKMAKVVDVEPSDLSVFEVVSGGQLERILHYGDIVLGVCLAWSVNWPQDDAKENHLTIKSNKDILGKIMPYLQLPPGSGGLNNMSLARNSTIPFSLFNELRFSDINCGKTFKKVLFEFVGAKLSIFKVTLPLKDLLQF